MWNENEGDLPRYIWWHALAGQNKSELYYTTKRNVKTQVCNTNCQAISVSRNCMYIDRLLIAGLQNKTSAHPLKLDPIRHGLVADSDSSDPLNLLII